MPASEASSPYIQRTDAAVRGLLIEKECQPILFIGAGLSRRYFKAPSWHDALRNSLKNVADDGPEYDFYVQKYGERYPGLALL